MWCKGGTLWPARVMDGVGVGAAHRGLLRQDELVGLRREYPRDGLRVTPADGQGRRSPTPDLPGEDSGPSFSDVQADVR